MITTATAKINREFELGISTLQPHKQTILRRARKSYGPLLTQYLHVQFSQGLSAHLLAVRLEQIARLVRDGAE